MIMCSRQIVLVAEDQILIRAAAVDVLRDHGYDVVEVGCADGALAILAERDIRMRQTRLAVDWDSHHVR
jgi:CheY-like chemotaxis protein